MFSVNYNGNLCYIDRYGKFLIKTPFQGGGNFFEGKAAFFSKNKFGFLDRFGKPVIEPKFERVKKFQEGVCAVKSSNKWGYIDSRGDFFIEPQYYDAGNFSYGLAGVISKKYGAIQYINKDNNIIIKDSGSIAIRDFSEGLLPAKDMKSMKWGYVNTKGRFAIQPKYLIANKFSEGMAGVGVKVGGSEKIGFIDNEGNFKLEPCFEMSYPLVKEGVVVVTKKTKTACKWGAIDKQGVKIIPFRFNYINHFSGGLAAAALKANGKIGFIDKHGKFCIEPKFDSVVDIFEPFKHGLAMVFKERKQLYIDKEGETIWEFK